MRVTTIPDTSGVIIFRVYFSKRLIIISTEAAALHEGGDARGDESHGYQIARCFSIKFQCARDDERRCDDGHEDGQ